MILSLVLAAATNQACTTLDSCYVSAKAAISEAVTVQYNDMESFTEARTVQCTGGLTNCTDVGSARDAYPDVSWTAVANVDGQGLRATPGSQFTGYSALREGNGVTIGRTGPGLGFTLQATFVARGRDPSFAVAFRDIGTNPVYHVGLERVPGKFVAYAFNTSRWATTERGKLVVASDRPWDWSFEGLRYGPREFSAVPRPGDIYEMYLTFRADGKVEIDIFSVSDTTRDYMMTHLQDTGAPIEAYPVQPPSGPWQAPLYRRIQTATVQYGNVLQMVAFTRALSRSERIAFHSKNLFWRMTGKAGTASLAIDQKACNSGGYLNLLQKERLYTVCGDRPGVLILRPGVSRNKTKDEK